MAFDERVGARVREPAAGHEEPGERRRRLLWTWALTAIALVFVAATGFRGLRVPEPTCDGLVEAAGTIVDVEVREAPADVPLLAPDEVALAACLRVAAGSEEADGATPLVQVLVCNATTDDLDIPLATSDLVAGLRLVDADGRPARRLPLEEPVSNGSFVADLPVRTCLLAEQALVLGEEARDGDLRVEATLGIAWGVEQGGQPPPQALTTPETIEQVVAPR